MQDVLLAQDTISGQEGRATANINGNIETMFYIKSLEASIEKNKDEVRTLGIRGVQHKTNGYSGSGSMTIHYVTSTFRKMLAQYAKTGVDTYFTLTVTNYDPTSSVGRQTTVLYNCNIDSAVVAKLDVEASSLDEDIDFTFDRFEIIEEFTKPSNM